MTFDDLLRALETAPTPEVIAEARSLIPSAEILQECGFINWRGYEEPDSKRAVAEWSTQRKTVFLSPSLEAAALGAVLRGLHSGG